MKIPLSIILILLLTLIIPILHSCEKPRPEEGAPIDCPNPIDNPSFSDNIVPILELHCYTCHDNENHTLLGEGIDLEDYSNVFPFAKNGKLLGSIKHEENCVPMPLDGEKIPDCDIQNIERWVLQGAMNN
ncbi:MAG: hypothetical protein AAF487_12975 [Bacteroidota bacterium]